MLGASFGGGATVTVNAAGSKFNAPPVLLDVCEREIVAEPIAWTVTVTVLSAPHESKVTEPQSSVLRVEV